MLKLTEVVRYIKTTVVVKYLSADRYKKNIVLNCNFINGCIEIKWLC